MDQRADLQPQSLHAVILALATRLAHSEVDALAWFHDERILRCGGLTAAELLASGQGEQALQFLLDIVEQELSHASPGHIDLTTRSPVMTRDQNFARSCSE